MICRCGTGLAASAFDLLTLRRISLEEKEEKEEEEGEEEEEEEEEEEKEGGVVGGV